jgi:hypothetical protein
MLNYLRYDTLAAKNLPDPPDLADNEPLTGKRSR